jgi:energy-coupling factor transport system substrate-specific component
MKDAIIMWRDTRMVVLTALIAATYAAVLIPFKVVIPLIPGFTEFRPASVIPVVFSILFGPAAAWGSGLGNFIGDMLGGTFGPGSGFGFVGNFLYGYLPYKLWRWLSDRDSQKEPLVRFPHHIGKYVLIVGIASAACAVFIAWGLDMLSLVPFNAFANIVFLHNVVVASILGPPILTALYPRVKRWGMVYSGAGSAGFVGRGRWLVLLLLLVSIGSGYLIGNAYYFGGNGSGLTDLARALGLGPSMAIMLLAVALL